ncbi:uncharacterized protein ACWYII_004627 [Salvelinus alpinus]
MATFNQPLNRRSNRPPCPSKHGIQLKSPSCGSNRPPCPSKHGIQLKSPSCGSNRPLNLSSKLSDASAMWHPALIPQKQPVAESQQNEPATIPQQVRYPAQMSQQRKQHTAMPQQQLIPMPQQLWHVAQMPQKQLAPMSPQKHYESTEDGASGSSQASIVEQSGVIPIYSYSSKSRYENGRTVFSQTHYTPWEAMPVDSGDAPKDSYVGIGAPSIYPPLVKDSERKLLVPLLL